MHVKQVKDRERGRKLRNLRERALLRGPELAKRVDCSPGYLRSLEAGLKPSRLLAHKLAAALTQALGEPVTLDFYFTPGDDTAKATETVESAA